jgi:hypothetical protein
LPSNAILHHSKVAMLMIPIQLLIKMVKVLLPNKKGRAKEKGYQKNMNLKSYNFKTNLKRAVN